MNSARPPVPPGFGCHLFDDPGQGPAGILLPRTLVDELVDKRETALADAAKFLAKKHEPEHRTSAGAALDPARESIGTRVVRPGVDYDPLERHKVYDDKEPVHLLRSAKGYADKRDQDRLIEQYKQLKPRGPLRTINRASGRAQFLAALARAQPHFAAVLRFLKGHLLATERQERPQRIPPLLLLGPPGVGKTHFTCELAQALGTTIARHSFDNAQNTSAFLGSDRHWGNSHYGLIYEVIALGECANPVILLDELDKPTRHSGIDPAAPLHTLLEPVSACSVRDISLDFRMDASLVTWIATANDASRIPSSLLSRFRVFNIECPSGANAIDLAEHVIATTLASLDVPASAVPRRLPAMLAHLNPRELRQACEDAVANAAAAGRAELGLQDFRELAIPDYSTARYWLH